MSVDRVGHALAAAAAAGWEVAVHNGRIRVRRFARAGAVEARAGTVEARAGAGEAWRGEVRALCPIELAAVLAADLEVELEAMSEAQRDAWRERAAVLEFDAGVARSVAERVAWCWTRSER